MKSSMHRKLNDIPTIQAFWVDPEKTPVMYDDIFLRFESTPTKLQDTLGRDCQIRGTLLRYQLLGRDIQRYIIG